MERRISMGSEKMPLQMLESPTTRVRCSTYVLEMRGDQEKRVKDYVYFYLDAFVVQGDKDIKFRGKKHNLATLFYTPVPVKGGLNNLPVDCFNGIALNLFCTLAGDSYPNTRGN